jgi:hypothetical protein
MQTWASVENGYWYARCTEFLGSPLMQRLRWMRVPGDTLFAFGALVLVICVYHARGEDGRCRSGLRGPAGRDPRGDPHRRLKFRPC